MLSGNTPCPRRRTSTGAWDQTQRIALLCVAVAAAGACGGAPPGPPPPPQKLGAQERILTVASAWTESTQTEAYVKAPDVAYVRATDQFTLHLRPHSTTALVDLQRTELIRDPSGREFHCEVSGAIQGVVRFHWRVDQAMVELHMPSAELPRRCKEPGFGRATKKIDQLRATYVLRSDQLVAVEPATLRSSLSPQ